MGWIINTYIKVVLKCYFLISCFIWFIMTFIYWFSEKMNYLSNDDFPIWNFVLGNQKLKKPIYGNIVRTFLWMWPMVGSKRVLGTCAPSQSNFYHFHILRFSEKLPNNGWCIHLLGLADPPPRLKNPGSGITTYGNSCLEFELVN